VFFLSCLSVRKVSRDLPADAGYLLSKVTMLVDPIKGTLFIRISHYIPKFFIQLSKCSPTL
jgi:hypothetical protein